MFWKRRRNPLDPSLTLLQQQLEELRAQLNVKNDQGRMQTVEYHFHIEKVDIHQPTLDEISFRLDQLDIEHLSGALNIGNNLGVSVKDNKKSPNEHRKSSNSPDVEPIVKTARGFSITIPAKEGR